MALVEDLTAPTWWRHIKNRIYQLNPQQFFVDRVFTALSFRVGQKFFHREMKFSRVTGEQISFESVVP